MISNYPHLQYALFQGGQKTLYLFEEARYCFVYGQFIASTLLCVSFIEHTLASHFSEIGRYDILKAGVKKLLNAAEKKSIINSIEYDFINKVIKQRNKISHFRMWQDEKGNPKDTIEREAIEQEKHLYELLEDDAKLAIKASYSMLKKFSIK